jgi:hypothetical protein
MWVWAIHIIVYPYILYKYWQTMNASYIDINEIYESRKIWVPMDCFLTLSVAGLYFVEIKYDKCDHKDDICNFSAKEKLLEGIDEDRPWG